MDMTVVVKMTLAGWPKTMVNDLCRVVLPVGYAGDEGLAEYTERVGIAHDWWMCVVQTGEMAGSNYTTWRLVDRDIPAADWVRCEVLTGINSKGLPEWSPVGHNRDTIPTQSGPPRQRLSETSNKANE